MKAVTAAQLAMAGSGEHTVSLDDAIEACRTTALDMHSHCEWRGGGLTSDKETSLGGLAASVKIPLCECILGFADVSVTGVLVLELELVLS